MREQQDGPLQPMEEPLKSTWGVPELLAPGQVWEKGEAASAWKLPSPMDTPAVGPIPPANTHRTQATYLKQSV